MIHDLEDFTLDLLNKTSNKTTKHTSLAAFTFTEEIRKLKSMNLMSFQRLNTC